MSAESVLQEIPNRLKISKLYAVLIQKCKITKCFRIDPSWWLEQFFQMAPIFTPKIQKWPYKYMWFILRPYLIVMLWLFCCVKHSCTHSKMNSAKRMNLISSIVHSITISRSDVKLAIILENLGHFKKYFFSHLRFSTKFCKRLNAFPLYLTKKILTYPLLFM